MDDWSEIKAWRGAQRAALITRREAFGVEERRAWGARITALLTEGFPMFSGMMVGFCWPYRGEFDARFAVRRWRELGARVALPEVKTAREPLQFRAWWPGAPMRRGVYGIPFPDGTEIVQPDAVLVPMNGYDDQGYRLGYGGGYFDRTLATLAPKPIAIGVTFTALRLATIHPQPHDLPMDFVVTEAGIAAVENGALVAIDTVTCRARTARLATARGLPRRREEETPVECSSPPCYAGEFPGYFGDEKK